MMKNILDIDPTAYGKVIEEPMKTLPSINELNLPSSDRRTASQLAMHDQGVAYTSRRRHSLPPHLALQEVEEEVPEEPRMRWRRISLDGNATVPSRLRVNARVNVEMDSDEEVVVPPERRPRKRSISEDIGDQDFVDMDSDEDKPKKSKIKRNFRGKRTKGKGVDCAGKDKCGLCIQGIPYYLQKSMNPGWRETLLAVFEYFSKRITYREWCASQKCQMSDLLVPDEISDKENFVDLPWLYLPDAYGFLEHHWDILCPPQHKNRVFSGNNWRKTLQDTLSHNRTYFVSGKDIFGKTGFWRLSDNIPTQNGVIMDSRSLIDLKLRQANPKPPSMFTIDALLKKAEAQGRIPSFSGSFSTVVTQAKEEEERASSPQSPSNNSELDILISAIEKMHSSAF
jgi:hypothetical protein